MPSQTSSVEHFFADLGRLDARQQEIALALRQEILKQAPKAQERMMYGGVMYSLQNAFCGLFVYKAHVSLEFGEGHKLHDPGHHLEGSGKLRRHLKFRQVTDIKAKQAATYIQQAMALQNQI